MALVKQKKSITYEETKRKGIHYLVDELPDCFGDLGAFFSADIHPGSRENERYPSPIIHALLHRNDA